MKPKTIQTIVFNGLGQIALGQFELGPCGDEEIVVKTLYTNPTR